MIRKHVITVIKRDENEEKARGYYEMVWENQSVEELLDYKMMKVHREFDADLSLTHGTTVM